MASTRRAHRTPVRCALCHSCGSRFTVTCRAPSPVPDPRQKGAEHAGAHRGMRDAEVLWWAEEEPGLDTDVEPIESAEQLRHAHAGYGTRETKLPSDVAVDGHVAAALDHRAAHTARLAEHELRGNVGGRHAEAIEPELLRRAGADVVQHDSERGGGLLPPCERAGLTGE